MGRESVTCEPKILMGNEGGIQMLQVVNEITNITKLESWTKKKF